MKGTLNGPVAFKSSGRIKGSFRQSRSDSLSYLWRGEDRDSSWLAVNKEGTFERWMEWPELLAKLKLITFTAYEVSEEGPAWHITLVSRGERIHYCLTHSLSEDQQAQVRYLLEHLRWKAD